MVAAGTAGEPTPTPDGGMGEFDGGTDPNRNKVQAGGICERLTTLQCAGEAHCCSNAGRTFAQCRSELMNECTTQLYMDDLAKNSATGFSAAQAELALARFEQQASTCDPNAILWPLLAADGLRGMFQGTRPPGQQCRPGGLASVLNYGVALASCAQIGTHACLFTGNGPIAAPENATCAARADVGATCYVDTNCKDDAYCANPQEKYSSGKCTARKAIGTACSNGIECVKQVCTGGMCAEPTAQDTWCWK